MARTLRDRFEGFVGRAGEHHIWLGATRPDTGTGRIKVEGTHRPAHRVAWELEHGPLEPDARVLPCPEAPACVRPGHLRLAGDGAGAPADGVTAGRGPRARRGTGSLREVAPGTWELAVTVGRYDDGRPRRQYRRVRADNRNEAARHLAAFVAKSQNQPPVVPREAVDLTFDDAVDRCFRKFRKPNSDLVDDEKLVRSVLQGTGCPLEEGDCLAEVRRQRCGLQICNRHDLVAAIEHVLRTDFGVRGQTPESLEALLRHGIQRQALSRWSVVHRLQSWQDRTGRQVLADA